MIRKEETVVFKEMKYKNGIKNGKEWTLYTLIDEDGRKFKTFDPEMAKVGVPLELSFTEEERSFQDEETGRTVIYTARDIIKPPVLRPGAEKEPEMTKASAPTQKTMKEVSDPFQSAPEWAVVLDDKLNRLIKGLAMVFDVLPEHPEVDRDEEAKG